MKTALIAGATGLCGKALLYTILKNKHYSRVFILVRKELAIKDPKLTQIIFNYDKEEDYKSILPEANDVFCCLGTTIKTAGSEEAFRKVDEIYPVKLAEACLAKGYKQFLIITAMGADSNSKFFYNKVKGDVEKRLKSLSFESLYICRPSLLLGDRNEFRLGELIGKFFAKFISNFLFGELRKYRAIEGLIVAKAMLTLAIKEEPGIHQLESDQLQTIGEQFVDR